MTDQQHRPAHTPGPLTKFAYSVLSNGKTTMEWAVRDGNGLDVASAYQNEADADLAVAAPDLLAACREALELIEFFHGKPGWSEYQQSPEMRRLRAAIAKATGSE